VRGVGLGDGLKAVLLVDGLPDGRGSVGVAFNDAESIGKHTNKRALCSSSEDEEDERVRERETAPVLASGLSTRLT
jgi:hypothetical protein